MPTNRQRRRGMRRANPVELTTDTLYELETGRNFFGGFRGDFQAFAAAWKYHREEVLPAFSAQHPGHRPFAWYVDYYGAEPVLPDALIAEARRRNWMKYRLQHVERPNWDEEPAFLGSRGLLTAAEEKALAAGVSPTN